MQDNIIFVVFNNQKAFHCFQTIMYNDLIIYNISHNTWTLVDAPGAPPSRSSHSAVSVATDNGQLWIFGGEFASPSEYQFYHYNDLWVFGLKNRNWTKIM